MRHLLIAALGAATLLAPLPVSAETGLTAYDAVRRALVAVWDELPLTVRNATLVEGTLIMRHVHGRDDAARIARPMAQMLLDQFISPATAPADADADPPRHRTRRPAYPRIDGRRSGVVSMGRCRG